MSARIRKCGPWQWEVLVDEDLPHIPGAHGTYSTIVWGSHARAERIGRKMSDWLGTLGRSAASNTVSDADSAAAQGES